MCVCRAGGWGRGFDKVWANSTGSSRAMIAHEGCPTLSRNGHPPVSPLCSEADVSNEGSVAESSQLTVLPAILNLDVPTKP